MHQIAAKERKENKSLGCTISKGHNNQLIFTKPGMEYDVFWTAYKQMYIHLYKHWGSKWVGFAEHFCFVWNDKAQDVKVKLITMHPMNARLSSKICPSDSSKHKCPWEGITSEVWSLRKDEELPECLKRRKIL